MEEEKESRWVIWYVEMGSMEQSIDIPISRHVG